MDVTVSAADANRRFSELLRGVREGKTYTVTSHGRPVAKIMPPEAVNGTDEKAALEALLTRLRSQPIRRIGPWTREELYERGAEE